MADGVVITELEARWIIQAMDYAAFALCNERVFMQDQTVITKDEEDSIEYMQHGENELAYAESILKVRLQEFFTGTAASASMVFPHDIDTIQQSHIAKPCSGQKISALSIGRLRSDGIG